MAAPSGGEDDEEFEICNDDGFVYKRARGLYPDVAPSSTEAAAGPDPEAARRRRRRRALLRLRDKRLRELSSWEALASNLLVPPPAPRQPPPQSPPASPRPAADTTATAASDSVLDDLLAQAEAQAELLNKVSQMCDEIQILCDAQEEAVVDSIASLTVWGNPKDLIKALCDSPDEQTAPGTSDSNLREDMWQRMQNEANGCFQRLDSGRERRTIEAGSYSGRKEAAAQMIKTSVEARKRGPFQFKRCSQFGHIENTCHETPSELGDELPPTILAESRKRKGSASPSGSDSVAAQAPNKSNRFHQSLIPSPFHFSIAQCTPQNAFNKPFFSLSGKKASGSISTPSKTQSLESLGPTTRRKATSTPTRADTFCSPGPTTRRRAAAAKNVSPEGSS